MRRNAGFTLLEVLVALALSALISVILLHGIRLAAAGLDRHTIAAERLDTRESLDELLRRTLGAATLLPQIAGGDFIGRPDAVAFLDATEDSGAGLYRVELMIDRARADRPLILRRMLATPTGDPRAAASIVASRIRVFRLAYFGADGASATPSWHDDWQHLGILPQLIRVIVGSDGDPPRPPLIVRLGNAG